MKVDVQKIIPIVLGASRLFYDETRVGHVETKGFGNFVTDADKAVQARIREGLAEIYPEVQFYAEEKDNGDVDADGDYWILDPIDGTMNLLHDFAHSAISLGYVEAGTLVLGVIYDPFRDELFYGAQGKGAYMLAKASQAGQIVPPSTNNACNASDHNELTELVNGDNTGQNPANWRPIHVSSAHSLAESVAIFGTAPYNRDEFGAQYKETVWRVFDRCQDIRRFGAAVLDLAWVACGRAEVYFEHVYPWDRAAGIVIVQEAGGKVCSFDGSPVPVLGFHDLIVGPPEVVDEVQAITGEVFGSSV